MSAASISLRSLAEKATPGPWRVGSSRARGQEIDINSGPEARLSYGAWQGLAVVNGSEEQPNAGHEVAVANAAYIAAANPSAVLALLDERDRLREALEAVPLRHQFPGAVEYSYAVYAWWDKTARAALAGGEQSQSKGEQA